MPTILFIHTVLELVMSEVEWISCCADRLQQQWPRAQRDELEETARELSHQDHWRCHRGDEAAFMWLQLGGLAQ